MYKFAVHPGVLCNGETRVKNSKNKMKLLVLGAVPQKYTLWKYIVSKMKTRLLTVRVIMRFMDFVYFMWLDTMVWIMWWKSTAY